MGAIPAPEVNTWVGFFLPNGDKVWAFWKANSDCYGDCGFYAENPEFNPDAKYYGRSALHGWQVIKKGERTKKT